MWVLVEEAVLHDRGEDEEEVLAQLVRAYLARRGLADTLHAFDAEQRAYHAVPDRPAAECDGGAADPQFESDGISLVKPYRDDSHEIDRRKSAQLLCLQQRFDAAAALMPPASLARIRLLCIQAQHLADTGDAVFFLASQVAPLVPFCTNPVVGHEVYTATLSTVLDPHRRPVQLDVETLAKEVNDELCGGGHPSSLDILFNWAYWQETSA